MQDSKQIHHKKTYSGSFKQQVVEFVLSEQCGLKYAARHFNLPDKKYIRDWRRIYLEEGVTALYQERRGMASKRVWAMKNKGSPQFLPKPNETLEEENRRLKAENDYLKKLKALILP